MYTSISLTFILCQSVCLIAFPIYNTGVRYVPDTWQPSRELNNIEYDYYSQYDDPNQIYNDYYQQDPVPDYQALSDDDYLSQYVPAEVVEEYIDFVGTDMDENSQEAEDEGNVGTVVSQNEDSDSVEQGEENQEHDVEKLEVQKRWKRSEGNRRNKRSFNNNQRFHRGYRIQDLTKDRIHQNQHYLDMDQSFLDELTNLLQHDETINKIPAIVARHIQNQQQPQPNEHPLRQITNGGQADDPYGDSQFQVQIELQQYPQQQHTNLQKTLYNLRPASLYDDGTQSDDLQYDDFPQYSGSQYDDFGQYGGSQVDDSGPYNGAQQSDDLIQNDVDLFYPDHDYVNSNHLKIIDVTPPEAIEEYNNQFETKNLASRGENPFSGWPFQQNQQGQKPAQDNTFKKKPSLGSLLNPLAGIKLPGFNPAAIQEQIDNIGIGKTITRPVNGQSGCVSVGNDMSCSSSSITYWK